MERIHRLTSFMLVTLLMVRAGAELIVPEPSEKTTSQEEIAEDGGNARTATSTKPTKEFFTIDDIKANPSLLPEFYELSETVKVSSGHVPFTIELFSIRDADMIRFEEQGWACQVYRLKTERQIMLLAREAFWGVREIRYVVSETTPQILYLDNSTGGNCFSCVKGFVISIESSKNFKVLGEVSGAELRDDGSVDLVVVDDTFESALGLCHACSPSLSRFYRIFEGKLVPDTKRNAKKCKRIIAECNEEMLNYSKSLPTSLKPTSKWKYYNAGQAYLRAALLKLLCYRELGEVERGVRELSTDLSAFGGDYFPMPKYSANSEASYYTVEALLAEAKQQI